MVKAVLMSTFTSKVLLFDLKSLNFSDRSKRCASGMNREVVGGLSGALSLAASGTLVDNLGMRL